jgi:hypothetical protein
VTHPKCALFFPAVGFRVGERVPNARWALRGDLGLEERVEVGFGVERIFSYKRLTICIEFPSVLQ